MKTLVLPLSLILALMAQRCMADVNLGIGVGRSTVEDFSESDVTFLDAGFNGGEVLDSFSQENTDTSFKIFVDYDLTSIFGLEAGYINYGEKSYSTYDDDLTYYQTATSHDHYTAAEIKTSGIYISVIPKIKYSNGIEIIPKLGALFWKQTGNHKSIEDVFFASDPDIHTTTKMSLSDDGIDLLVGIGIAYDRYAIEYELAQIDNYSINTIMLAVRF